jgi:hypothetical protein
MSAQLMQLFAEPQKAQQPDFEQFWMSYPKKQAKKVARDSWKRISWEPGLFEKIMSSIEQFRRTEQWAKDGGLYIPMPATWLNQERWEDELEVSIQASPCNWPGCKAHGQTQRGTRLYCQRHIDSFQRGETP